MNPSEKNNSIKTENINDIDQNKDDNFDLSNKENQKNL